MSRFTRKAISKAVAIGVVVIVVIAIVGVVAYLATRPAPTPTTPTTPTSPITTPTSPTTPTTPTTPTKRLELVYVTTQATATFDPAKHRDETETICVVNTYDPLLYPTKGGPPQPWIATEWNVSEDGLVWTFKIRKGVKFHSGRELTAEDVAFSMNRALALKSGFSFLWLGIVEKAEAVDKYTVKFYLKEPYAEFPATLVHLFVVDKEECLKHKQSGPYGEYGDYCQAWLAEHDAGSGPYRVVEFKKGEKIVFEKFPDYWKGWPEGAPERVNFYVVGEQATEVAMLKAGKADMVEQWLSPETFMELKKVPGIIVKEDPDVKLFFVSLHNMKPPFDDVNVRRAVSWAINYTEIIEVVFKGGYQAVGPVPILAPGHNPDVPKYSCNLEKAMEYLKKSKYWSEIQSGKRFKVEYCYVSALESERMVGLLLKKYLEPLGIDVELRPETWARIVELVKKPETTPHMVAIFHTLKYPSPDCHTYLMFHTKSHGTYMSCMWYSNPEVDRLLDQARRTPDQKERYRLYGEVQKIVTDEAAALFLVNPVHRIAYRDWVKNYEYIGLLGFDLRFYNLRIEGKP